MLWVNGVCLVAVVGAIFARLWTGGGVTDPRLPAYPEDLHRHFNTTNAPLNSFTEKELCPCSAALEKINASLR